MAKPKASISRGMIAFWERAEDEWSRLEKQALTTSGSHAAIRYRSLGTGAFGQQRYIRLARKPRQSGPMLVPIGTHGRTIPRKQAAWL